MCCNSEECTPTFILHQQIPFHPDPEGPRLPHLKLHPCRCVGAWLGRLNGKRDNNNLQGPPTLKQKDFFCPKGEPLGSGWYSCKSEGYEKVLSLQGCYISRNFTSDQIHFKFVRGYAKVLLLINFSRILFPPSMVHPWLHAPKAKASRVMVGRHAFTSFSPAPMARRFGEIYARFDDMRHL